MKNDPALELVIDENLEILGVLGAGGMATVYKAHHKAFDIDVAVKVLDISQLADSKAIQRFCNEAKVLSQLSQKNIVRLYTFGVLPDQRPYIVMEYLSSQSLDQTLRNSGGLDVEIVLEIITQTASALQAAHECGVVHRDLKPSNLYVKTLPDGTVQTKVADFGICQTNRIQGGEYQRLTQTGVVIGTPLYMSPEQCMSASCDLRSDIYSLGCVFFELITGRRPFECDSSLELMMMHTTQPAPTLKSLRNLPAKYMPQLEQIVSRMMEKRADDRYQSCADLLADLDALKNGSLKPFEQPNAKPAGADSNAWAAAPKKPVRSTWVLTLAACLIIACIGAVALYFNKSNTSQTHAGAQLPPEDLEREAIVEMHDPRLPPFPEPLSLLADAVEADNDKQRDDARNSAISFIAKVVTKTKDGTFKFADLPDFKHAAGRLASDLVQAGRIIDRDKDATKPSEKRANVQSWLKTTAILTSLDKHLELIERDVTTLQRKYQLYQSIDDSATAEEKLLLYKLADSLANYYDSIHDYAGARRYFSDTRAIDARFNIRTQARGSRSLAEAVCRANNKLGSYCLMDGKIPDAIRYYEETINLCRDTLTGYRDKEYYHACLHYDVCLIWEGRYQQALDDLEKISFPSDVKDKNYIYKLRADCWKAYAYSLLGKQDEAASCLTQVEERLNGITEKQRGQGQNASLHYLLLLQQARLAELANKPDLAEIKYCDAMHLCLKEDASIFDWVQMKQVMQAYEKLVEGDRGNSGREFDKIARKFDKLRAKNYPLDESSDVLVKQINSIADQPAQ
jgi:tRNA A-37 threonylcarbamoyl transferase component Bud32